MVDEASQKLNQLEKKYLVTTSNLNDFSHGANQCKGFNIITQPQLKLIKQNYHKHLPHINKVLRKIGGYGYFGLVKNDHILTKSSEIDKALHDDNVTYIDSGSMLSNVEAPVFKKVSNDFSHNDYLLSWDYLIYRPVKMSDLKILKQDLGTYLLNKNVIWQVHLLMVSDYSGSQISKQTDISQSIISKIRHGKRKISNLRFGTVLRLEKFLKKTPLYKSCDVDPESVIPGINDIKTEAEYKKTHPIK